MIWNHDLRGYQENEMYEMYGGSRELCLDGLKVKTYPLHYTTTVVSKMLDMLVLFISSSKIK